jgi:hypothetical protein
MSSRLRLRRGFVVVIAIAALSSTGHLVAVAIPWTIVAAGTSAILFAAAVHAFVFGLYVRLIARIADAFRLRSIWRHTVAALVAVTMAVAYWRAVSADGADRQLAVEAVLLLGLAIYVVRRDLARELRVRVGARMGR